MTDASICLQASLLYEPPGKLQTAKVNPLRGEEILDWSKLKALTDDKPKVAQLAKFVLDRVENIVGKRCKCWLPAFSSFPTMVLKAVFLRLVKSWHFVMKGQLLHRLFSGDKKKTTQYAKQITKNQQTNTHLSFERSNCLLYETAPPSTSCIFYEQ